ncbi:hypothetical protein ACJX0J_027693, partial [Zea mays]
TNRSDKEYLILAFRCLVNLDRSMPGHVVRVEQLLNFDLGDNIQVCRNHLGLCIAQNEILAKNLERRLSLLQSLALCTLTIARYMTKVHQAHHDLVIDITNVVIKNRQFCC